MTASPRRTWRRREFSSDHCEVNVLTIHSLLRPQEYDARLKQTQIVAAPSLTIKAAWPKPSGEEPIGCEWSYDRFCGAGVLADGHSYGTAELCQLGEEYRCGTYTCTRLHTGCTDDQVYPHPSQHQEQRCFPTADSFAHTDHPREGEAQDGDGNVERQEFGFGAERDDEQCPGFAQEEIVNFAQCRGDCLGFGGLGTCRTPSGTFDRDRICR